METAAKTETSQATPALQWQMLVWTSLSCPGLCHHPELPVSSGCRMLLQSPCSAPQPGWTLPAERAGQHRQWKWFGHWSEAAHGNDSCSPALLGCPVSVLEHRTLHFHMFFFRESAPCVQFVLARLTDFRTSNFFFWPRWQITCFYNYIRTMFYVRTGYWAVALVSSNICKFLKITTQGRKKKPVPLNKQKGFLLNYRGEMALQQQPRGSSEILPALPIVHSLAKPHRSPAESYCYHGR